MTFLPGIANHYKWLTSRKPSSVEELEIIPVGRRAKDITPSTAWRRERGRKRKRSTTFPETAIVSQTKKYWKWSKASLWNF